MKEFRDPKSNRVIATAEISDNYLIGAALNDQAQNAKTIGLRNGQRSDIDVMGSEGVCDIYNGTLLVFNENG